MSETGVLTQPAKGEGRPVDDRYKWVALSNTSLGMFMSVLDSSIVIIAMPAIFRGIGLNPLAPGNITYLLWMIMGYLLVVAALVVSFGRLGDMFGRVRIYNLGFLVFTLASIALSLDPMRGTAGALWLIIGRVIQATGGAMLMSNSAAILTDAFPVEQRGMALGINQIVGLSGQFVGLVAGGLLAAIDWRAVFWVNVPFGLFGTIWAYRMLRETASRSPGRIDWWGNLTFALGLGLILLGITFGIQPYHHHTMGWSSPKVLGSLVIGTCLLALFCLIETRVGEPMFNLGLFRIRAFAAGGFTALLASIARGGLQFMLIIWLQGIWLPLHGFDFSDTPLWAGIFLLPLTVGFITAGPVSGYLSDRYGARVFATGGMVVFCLSFVGLLLLPINFPYWVFAVLALFNGIGSGMFSAPNTASLMSAVPPDQRGQASGMRATFMNSGQAISIGVFFSLLITGLQSTLPHALSSGLRSYGVPAGVADHAASLPPVSTVFSAFLGFNPIQTLLSPSGVLHQLPAHAVATLTGKQFFPELLSRPFHHGLVVVFTVAALMSALAAVVSAMRGTQYHYQASPSPATSKPQPADGLTSEESPARAARAARADWAARAPQAAGGAVAVPEVAGPGKGRPESNGCESS